MDLSSSKNKKKEKETKLEENKEKEVKKIEEPKNIENNIIEKNKNEQKNNNIKKIKNIISDKTSKDNNDFDVLFIVDATGSMGNYIKAAKEETQNISQDLRQTYPEMMFKYGYVFYRDPIDSKNDIHEIINLTDNVNSIPEQISKIKADGGGDEPEDWVGAYKIANEKISWRNGIRIIIHLADAGAHGKLFTNYDKYPEEEEKLIIELEKCLKKNIDIFGYVILEGSRNSFEQCSKIYRSKGGSYEIINFFQNQNYTSRDSRDDKCEMRRRVFRSEEREDFQSEVNMNFRMNAVRNVGDRMKRRKENLI